MRMPGRWRGAPFWKWIIPRWPRTPDLPHAARLPPSPLSKHAAQQAFSPPACVPTAGKRRLPNACADEERGGGGGGAGPRLVYSLLKSDEAEARGGMQMPSFKTKNRVTEPTPLPLTSKSQGAAEQQRGSQVVQVVFSFTRREQIYRLWWLG